MIVSVPHAGRIYPPEILAATRVPREQLERLEDSWCDTIAARACEAGAVVVEALWARAVADCNRGEGQMAPGEVDASLHTQFSAPGRKERAGLGVIPTRLAGCGPLWRRPIDRAALHWRLESFHRPYHAALAEELAAARHRSGRAVLIDLHSMPPIPGGQPGHGAQIVVGDRFGTTAAAGLVDLVMEAARGLGVPAVRNQPYAGGHIVRTHGKPERGVHAIQIEIDRSLYLASDRLPDRARAARLADWFAHLAARLAAAGDDSLPLAAE
ncbi:N-formylglutamate amidohydrolase [Sphingopyxis flava]|uniref:N-formylglutamate amidohydrolase n=1 Tax=Sphingopyxis flava TaxID=1507287 RepID=A0A1T5CCA0_9SPHN|nr:N-formylglutamate amidohydrolase [Sphingopyxis flava]